MNHREYVGVHFDKWFNSFDWDGKSVLELGDGNRTFFKNKFLSARMKYHAEDPFIVGREQDDKMESLSWSNESFDLIFMCHAFEHCERPVDALKEAFRVLKPGGMVYIATPYPCYHHILGADLDHIMVLGSMQMERLLLYTGFAPFVSESKEAPIEQDYNIISVGRKP